jgi:hypothetical protein
MSDRTPKQMREDSIEWSRAKYPVVAIGRYRDAADQIERLRQEILDLNARVTFLESREVCGAAHDHVDECGYCQRDELRTALRDLIPVAMNEYPEGDHPAVTRAHKLIGY